MSTPPPTKLTNIGPKSAAWLRQVGVRTEEDLKALGAMGVFLKVKRAGFKPSLNLLYALAGAELGVHWASLDPDYKAKLVAEVAAFDEAAKQKKKFGSGLTPARDVSLADYGQSSESSDSSEVVDTDPGLFDSADDDGASSPDSSDSSDGGSSAD